MGAAVTVSYLDEGYLQEKGLPQEDQRTKALEDLYLQTVGSENNPQAQAAKAQLFDRRPDWYKRYADGFDAPPVVSTGAAAAQAGVGAAADAAKAKADYYERAGFKPDFVAGQHKKAGMLGVGSQVLGALLGGQSAQFDQQQKRAALEAQMATAGKGSGNQGMTPNEILGGMNYFKTKLRNEQLWQKQVDEAKETFAKADPNSPESRSAQQVLVQAGMLKPEQAGQFNATQLKEGKTALMQRESEDFRAEEFDRQQDRQENQTLGKEEREQLARVDEEQRKEEQRRQESFVPGWAWANDTPPSTAEVSKARQAVSDRDLMIKGSDELQQIQDKLEEANGLAAAAGTTVLRYLGDDESKELLSRGKRLTHEMNIAARRLGAMGVPQLFEQQMVEAVNPNAGDIGTLFKGKSDWRSTGDFYRNETGKQLKTLYGIYEQDDPERPTGGNRLAKPAEQQVRTYARPPVRRHGEQPAPQAVTPAAPGQAAGVPPQAPAGYKGSKVPANTYGFFQLRTPRGTTTAYPLSKKRYDEAVKAYGAENVIQVQ